MMEPAEEMDGSGRLHRATERGADAIVLVGIGMEDLAKMRFAKDQDIVEALSPG